MKKLFLLFLLKTTLVNAAQVQSVNFIQEGDISKLIIDLDEDTFVEEIKVKKDKQILLDFQNTSAAKRYLRSIDTSEFAGAAVLISPYTKGANLRFAIQLRDNVRSILSKEGSRVTLSLENRFGVFSKNKIDLSNSDGALNSARDRINIPKSYSIQDILQNLTQSGTKKYIGKKISINVNNMPYSDLLKIIAETSGFNIIIDDAVSKLKPLTINLASVPWDNALDTVLGLGDLVAKKRNNILTIQTQEQARLAKQKQLEYEKSNKVQEPLVTKVFPLSYADVDKISDIIKGYLTDKRGRVQQDKRTSQLIVTDTVEVIERIKSIVKTLDTQEPQVIIESKIVEVNEGYELKVGLGANGISAGYDPVSSTANLGANAGTFSISSAPNVEASSLFNASISVFKRLTNLTFQLDLMESESKGRVVTSPKIITENNQKAEIFNVETVPFNVSTTDEGGNIGTSFEEAEAKISLGVTPKVTNEGAIAMDVDIVKEGFSAEVSPGTRPPKSSNSIKTKVLVDNGSTVVIGGLYKTSATELQSGVPILKDLPLVGWLFKSAYNPKKSRSEMIVFLTPRIINQKEAGLTTRDESGLVQ